MNHRLKGGLYKKRSFDLKLIRKASTLRKKYKFQRLLKIMLYSNRMSDIGKSNDEFL